MAYTGTCRWTGVAWTEYGYFFCLYVLNRVYNSCVCPKQGVYFVVCPKQRPKLEGEL